MYTNTRRTLHLFTVHRLRVVDGVRAPPARLLGGPSRGHLHHIVMGWVNEGVYRYNLLYNILFCVCYIPLKLLLRYGRPVICPYVETTKLYYSTNTTICASAPTSHAIYYTVMHLQLMLAYIFSICLYRQRDNGYPGRVHCSGGR